MPFWTCTGISQPANSARLLIERPRGGMLVGTLAYSQANVATLRYALAAWLSSTVGCTVPAKRKSKRKRVRDSTSSPSLAVAKRPRLIGPQAIEGRYLAWRFSNGDQGGPFSVKKLTDTDRHELWRRMTDYEGMTATELSAKNHPIPQQRLAPEARKRLRELQLDDLVELWSFRITGKRRFWCIKNENVYALLWWDPWHRVYPVQKRNT